MRNLIRSVQKHLICRDRIFRSFFGTEACLIRIENMRAAYQTEWYCPEARFRYDGGLMTDPNELRQPLADLLQVIEVQDREQASSQARQIASNLDNAVPGPDPLGREFRPATVKFSGLCHALLRDLRSAEKHIAVENWDSAAKVVRGAIQLLPESYTFGSTNYTRR